MVPGDREDRRVVVRVGFVELRSVFALVAVEVHDVSDMEEERRRSSGHLRLEVFDHRLGDILLGIGVQDAAGVPGYVEHPLATRRRDTDFGGREPIRRQSSRFRQGLVFLVGLEGMELLDLLVRSPRRNAEATRLDESCLFTASPDSWVSTGTEREAQRLATPNTTYRNLFISRHSPPWRLRSYRATE